MIRTGDCKKFYELFLKKVTGEKISLEDSNFMSKHATFDIHCGHCGYLERIREGCSCVCENIDLSLDLAQKITADRSCSLLNVSADEINRLAIAIFEGISQI